MNVLTHRAAGRTGLCLGVAVISTGCATVMRGPTEMLGVVTEPPGAVVEASSGGTCVAPCELEVRRRGALTVTAQMDGCGRESIAVRSEIDRFGGWMLGAYGGAALGAVAYEAGEEVTEAIGHVLPGVLVCGALGADPENCLPEPEDDGGNESYVLLPLIPAAVDLATGAVFARSPNPARIELDCR